MGGPSRWLPREAWALLAAALLVRLAWVALNPVDPDSDFLAYHQHAERLVELGYYGGDDYPDAYWPPGWPLALTPVYWVFGAHAQAGAAFGAVLEWGAMVLASVAAVRLLPRRFALGAVGAMCLYPAGIAFAPVLATEHLTALLFTGLVVLLAFAAPTPRVALAAGALEGALLLTRGDYGTAMAVVLALWLVRAVPARRVPALGALAVAGALVFTGPWIVRNAMTFGEFVPASANGGFNFYLGTVSVKYKEPPIVKAVGQTSTTKPAARDRTWWRLGRERVADDPLRWLAYDVRRIPIQYGTESTTLGAGEIRSPWAYRIARAYWLAIVALALGGLGVVVARRRRLPGAWTVIAGSICAVFLLKLAFMVGERDRLPLAYLIIVLAGLGAERLWSALRPPDPIT